MMASINHRHAIDSWADLENSWLVLDICQAPLQIVRVLPTMYEVQDATTGECWRRPKSSLFNSQIAVVPDEETALEVMRTACELQEWHDSEIQRIRKRALDYPDAMRAWAARWQHQARETLLEKENGARFIRALTELSRQALPGLACCDASGQLVLQILNIDAEDMLQSRVIHPTPNVPKPRQIQLSAPGPGFITARNTDQALTIAHKLRRIRGSHAPFLQRVEDRAHAYETAALERQERRWQRAWIEALSEAGIPKADDIARTLVAT